MKRRVMIQSELRKFTVLFFVVNASLREKHLKVIFTTMSNKHALFIFFRQQGGARWWLGYAQAYAKNQVLRLSTASS